MGIGFVKDKIQKFADIKLTKLLLFALKIALASSLAVYLAQKFRLEYATSSGTIALLTIMTTKWDTVKLSCARLVTMLVTILVAWIVFPRIDSLWIAYGCFVLVIAFLLEGFGLRSTISVNSVMGAHLLSNHDFSAAFIKNEVLLVMIGISTAFIVNLFNDNVRQKKEIEKNMTYTEHQLQMIMGELAAYLADKQLQRNVWEDLHALEHKLSGFIQLAYEYQENTFQSHPEYYILYFEMRLNQCHLLHNLHSEMRKIKKIPKQALVISYYLIYLMDFVVERNEPYDQIEKLEQIFSDMKKEELPKTREEFENRAILYHILMDIEEFLVYKQHFVKSLSDVQKKVYWQGAQGGINDE